MLFPSILYLQFHECINFCVCKVFNSYTDFAKIFECCVKCVILYVFKCKCVTDFCGWVFVFICVYIGVFFLSANLQWMQGINLCFFCYHWNFKSTFLNAFVKYTANLQGILGNVKRTQNDCLQSEIPFHFNSKCILIN